jgi:hypothetical protein
MAGRVTLGMVDLPGQGVVQWQGAAVQEQAGGRRV